MSIEQLQYLVAIKKYGTLKEAAEHLNVTLSALSQGLNKIEAELGLTLFSRSRAGSIITEEGKVIIKHAKKVLDELSELDEHAQLLKNRLRGQLKVSAIPGPFFELATVIRDMKNKHSDITVNIAENNSQSMFEGISRHQLDVGLVIYSHEDILKYPKIQFEKIMDCYMLVVAHKDSPIIKNNQINTIELSKQPVILFNEQSVLSYMNNLNQQFGDNHWLITVNNSHIITQYLQENRAYTIGLTISFETTKENLENIVFADLRTVVEDETNYYFGIAYSKEKRQSHLVKLFIESIYALFQQN